MKSIIIFLIVVASSISKLEAQSNLIFTSDNDSVRFFIEIDGTQLNLFYETWVKVSNVPAGFHDVRVVFEGDTIADWTKKIMLKANTELTYSVLEKKALSKEISVTGRQIGKKINVGEHDSTFAYLQDVYILKNTHKADVVVEGEETTVSTEQSLSTSILRAEKKKLGEQ